MKMKLMFVLALAVLLGFVVYQARAIMDKTDGENVCQLSSQSHGGCPNGVGEQQRDKDKDKDKDKNKDCEPNPDCPKDSPSDDCPIRDRQGDGSCGK